MGRVRSWGIDPLYVANEGKLLAVISPEAADVALKALRDVKGGEEASIIGESWTFTGTCAGLTMGVRSARVALREIGPHSSDEEVVVIIETDM